MNQAGPKHVLSSMVLPVPDGSGWAPSTTQQKKPPLGLKKVLFFTMKLWKLGLIGSNLIEKATTPAILGSDT
jgi:hypothetical protein